MVSGFTRVPLITYAFSWEKGIMAYSALDVAKYVIAHENNQGRNITNLRLQKLLYFVQAKVLCEGNDECFSDEMEAWDFGPVAPDVYHNYKVFGAMNLTETSKPPRFLAHEELIDSMLDNCAKFSTNKLVEITHRQKPWKDAYAKGRGTVIPNEEIKKFFINGN